MFVRKLIFWMPINMLLTAIFFVNGVVFAGEESIVLTPEANDTRFCGIYMKIVSPALIIGAIALIIGIIALEYYKPSTRDDDSRYTGRAKKILLYVLGIVLILLVMTRITRGVYNIMALGKFHADCF